MSEPTAIVGETVAGEAAKIKKAIVALIKGLNSSTFDLAEALHTAKVKNYYASWGYDTFSGYLKTLDLKSSKGYYLCRIVETMLIAGVPREVYESVGVAKLRVITKLDPLAEFEGKPLTSYIKSLTEVAKDTELETLKEAVAHLQGQTGDEARVWLNVSVGKSQRDSVILPAIELAKKLLGTVATNAEGEPQDASDGRALEIICAAFLADEDNGYTPPAPVTVVPVPQADGYEPDLSETPFEEEA